MSWLDDLLAKRKKSPPPKTGSDVFAEYRFTEDRRDAAQADRLKASQPGNLFDNATRERAASRKRKPTAGQPAMKIHVDSDELDPEIAKQIQRGAPRRSAKRIVAPLNYYYFPTPEHFVPLELTVIHRDDATKVVDCFLFDVNDSGISFAAPEEFPPGSELTILGHHAEDLTPLIATDVMIVNYREYPAQRAYPDRFGQRPLWVHGTRMAIQDALLLYKATLDSIALNVALTPPDALTSRTK